MSRIRDHHTRTVIAFGAACDAALSVALIGGSAPGSDAAGELQQLGLLITGACVVVTALGLVAYAAALNDLLDRARDAVRGDRIAGSGTGPGTILLNGSLLLALFAALALPGDSIAVALVLASLLLFHNAVARFIPAIGLLVPGAVVAGVMLVPDWQLQPSLVVWFTMTVFVATSIAVHIAGDRRPRVSLRASLIVATGWVVLSGIVLSLSGRGLAGVWPQGHAAGLVWPGVTAIMMVGVVVWRLRSGETPAARAGGALRTVALWQPMLATAWCMAMDMSAAALAFAVVGACGLVCAGGARGVSTLRTSSLPWR